MMQIDIVGSTSALYNFLLYKVDTTEMLSVHK